MMQLFWSATTLEDARRQRCSRDVGGKAFGAPPLGDDRLLPTVLTLPCRWTAVVVWFRRRPDYQYPVGRPTENTTGDNRYFGSWSSPPTDVFFIIASIGLRRRCQQCYSSPAPAVVDHHVGCRVCRYSVLCKTKTAFIVVQKQRALA
jgi:hypothetical protein